MKYIVCRVYRKRAFFADIPVSFPEYMVHSTMYEHIRAAILAHWKPEDGYRVKALSAGVYSSMDNFGECHGGSQTLGVKSRGTKDSQLLRMADYGSCLEGG